MSEDADPKPVADVPIRDGDAGAEGDADDVVDEWQADKVERSLRRLPRLILQSIRMTWKASPRLFLLTIILQVASAVGVGAQLLLGKRVLDQLLGGERTTEAFGEVLPYLVGLVVLTVALSVSQAIQKEQGTVLGEHVSRLAFNRVLDIADAVELKAFESPVFYDRLERAIRNGTTRPFQMVNGVILLASSGLTILGLSTALVFLSPILLPLTLLACVPLWVAVLRNSRATHDFYLSMTKIDRERFYLLFTMTGRDEAKEIRAFALNGLLRNRYEDLFDQYLKGLRKLARRRIQRSLLASLGTSGLTVVVLGLLGYLYLDDSVSLAAAGTAVAAFLALTSRLQALLSAAGLLYEGSLFLEDYSSFVELLPRVEAARPVGRAPERFAKLVAEDVSFTYPGAATPALRNVNLEIADGEIVALVGENGSGKTTLAKLLANLYRPTDGRVLWDGVDIATLDPAAVRDSISVIFQDFVKYRLTAHENVAAGRAEFVDDRERAREAALDADADSFLSRLPSGYESLLGKQFGGSDLSIGQWQRVALARAFFRDAPFLILDEPTSALDPRAEYELFERLRNLLAGRSVLLISHRFSSVRSADRIYVLDKGVVRENGSHDELMRVGGLYAELFTLQAAAYLGDQLRTAPAGSAEP